MDLIDYFNEVTQEILELNFQNHLGFVNANYERKLNIVK